MDKSFEGLVVTSRSLESYTSNLNIDKKVLFGSTVLNVGSGGSNIGKEFPGDTGKKVVNVDLLHDPYFSILPLSHLPRSLFAKLVERADPNNVHLKRQMAGTEGRTMVQADAFKLPFKDDQFDYVLANWFTQQIPVEKRNDVIRELVRVGKHIHIAPVFEVDIPNLLDMHKNGGVTIVSCTAQPTMMDPPPFTIEDASDYARYVNEHPKLSERAVMPQRTDVSFKKKFGRIVTNATGGNSLILCKDKYL